MSELIDGTNGILTDDHMNQKQVLTWLSHHHFRNIAKFILSLP